MGDYSVANDRSTSASPSALKPFKLADFVKQNKAALSKIPGQRVEMTGNNPNTERVYIYTLPSSNSRESNIQLIFSLMAFGTQSKPVASLILAENYERVRDVNISLAYLDTARWTLIDFIKGRGTTSAADRGASASRVRVA